MAQVRSKWLPQPRRRWSVGLLAGLIGLALVMAAPGSKVSSAAEEPKPAEKAALPDDLDRIPPASIFTVTVRVADLWSHESAKGVREMFQKQPGLVQEISKFLGAAPAEIERLTLVMAEPRQHGPVFAVATIKPYDKAKVLKAAVPGAKEEKVKDKYVLHANKEHQAVWFVADRTYFIGDPGDLAEVIEMRADGKKSGGLSAALKAAAGKHVAVLGVNTQRINEEFANQLPPQAEPYKPLLEARSAVAILDLGKEITATARLEFPNTEATAKGDKAAKALMALGQEFVAKVLADLGKDKEAAQLVGVLKQAEAALKTAKLQKQETTLEAKASLQAEPAVLAAAALDAVQRIRLAAMRAQSANNLKQIALALHSYHDVYGAFPPAAVYGKDGKPLYSWRVLLLPFLEQDKLYKEFHLDEPWDSEHNKKLLARMPKVFQSPAAKGDKPGQTHYQAFVGKGAIFEGSKGVKINDITDGTSNTIIVVETATPIEWTKPGDLPYKPNQKLPKLTGLFPGGFQAAFADGSVRFLSNKVNEKTLHLLIQRNDGQPVPQEF